MNKLHSVFIILAAAAVTFLLRAFPFLLFGGSRKMPEKVERIASLLPPAIISVLIIYCLKSELFSFGYPLLADALGIASVLAVHLWKRNTLLSIAVGTAVYMLCIRLLPGIL